MAYDDVILRMGEFGRYQRRIYLILCLPIIICAFHKMGGSFLAGKFDKRCLLPVENLENASYKLDESDFKLSYPPAPRARDRGCKKYDIEIPENVKDLKQYFSFARNNTRKWKTSSCKQFVYDKTEYKMKRTIVSDWNIVCEDDQSLTVSDSVFMGGVMLGSMIFGFLSDTYGRKPTFFIALILQLISGVAVAASPNLVFYAIFRAIVGCATSGVFLVAYVLALEMVGPRRRLVAGVGVQLFFAGGYCLTSVLAYFFRNWSTLQLVLSLPSLCFLMYWWFIPESARWLLSKDRKQEAKEVLQSACQENGVTISDDTMEALLNVGKQDKIQDEHKPSILELFRYPNLRRKSLLLFFCWFINSGTYYGISWGSAELTENMFLSYFISGIVEVPAYIFLILTLDRWGRKVIYCGSMITTGVFLSATVLVPEGMDWLNTIVVMIGKFSISASYSAIYLFSAEQFPTVVRNVGMGTCSTIARVGAIIAPWINRQKNIWTPLPYVIFGVAVLVGGLMSLFLPETLNTKLPESILDGEKCVNDVINGTKKVPEVKLTSVGTSNISKPENGVPEELTDL